VVGLVADRAREVSDEEPVLVPDLPVLLQLGLPRQVQPVTDHIEQDRSGCPNELRRTLKATPHIIISYAAPIVS